MWPHFVVISSTNGPMQIGQLNVGSGGGGGGGNGGGGAGATPVSFWTSTSAITYDWYRSKN